MIKDRLILMDRARRVTRRPRPLFKIIVIPFQFFHLAETPNSMHHTDLDRLSTRVLTCLSAAELSEPSVRETK